MNIYDLANAELERLYKHWYAMIDAHNKMISNKELHFKAKEYAVVAQQTAAKIAEMRELILARLKDHDAKLHEKIAEIAMMGQS